VSPWEQVAASVIELLIAGDIDPDQAASWLWSLVEYAETVAS